MIDGDFRVLSLFAGIGGFDLGLETISDDSLLRDRHVCKESAEKALADSPADRRHSETERAVEAAATANVIVGGFPCQDLSYAGKGAGINGSRSGLWSEMRRTIGMVRPEWVIVENVSALLFGERGAWFGRVLGDLATLGYDAEWHCIPASYVGAPHIRDRVWIIAHSNISKNNIGSIGEIYKKWDKVSGSFSKGNWRGPVPKLSRVGNGIPKRLEQRLGSLGNAVVPEVVRRLGHAILNTYDEG
jgi:DNA (cytosine-5)-methyltransferase 1